MRLRGFLFMLSVFIILFMTPFCTTTTVHTVPQKYRNEPEQPVPPDEGSDEESFFGVMNREEAPARKEQKINSKEGCSCPTHENSGAERRESEPVLPPPDQISAKESVQARSAPSDSGSFFGAEASVTEPAREEPPEKDAADFDQTGTASWYGRDFDGKSTASGQAFDSRKLTAAHRTIPLGSIVLVRNTENDKEILVTVNDRGPYVDGRIIDMSEYGAELLGYKEQGLTTVSIRVVREGNANAKGEGVTASYFAGSAAGVGTGDFSPASIPIQKAKYTESSANVIDHEKQKGFGVQVGVFGDLKNAVGMKVTLASYGEAVNIYKKQNYYIVSVGEFVTRYQAERLKSELITDGYHAFIVEPEGSDYAQFR